MTETSNQTDGLEQRLEALLKDLETMSMEDLQMLSQKVEDEVKDRRNKAKLALTRKYAEEARLYGLTVEMRDLKSSDHSSSSSQKKSRTKTEIKYRNPDNPSETWTGRGKRPMWVNRLLEAKGLSPKDVKDLAVHLPELLVQK